MPAQVSPIPMISKALPRLLLLTFLVVIAVDGGDAAWIRLTAIGCLLLSLPELLSRHWWHYARTGEVLQRQPAPAFTEPGTWTVELSDAGVNSTSVIRTLRQVRALSLVEAHQLATATPAALARGVSEDSARAIATAIERAGGSARVLPSPGAPATDRLRP